MLISAALLILLSIIAASFAGVSFGLGSSELVQIAGDISLAALFLTMITVISGCSAAMFLVLFDDLDDPDDSGPGSDEPPEPGPRGSDDPEWWPTFESDFANHCQRLPVSG